MRRRLIERYQRREQARFQQALANPELPKRSVRRRVLVLLLAFGFLIGSSHGLRYTSLTSWAIASVAQLVIAAFAGAGLLSPPRRALAYAIGWRAARRSIWLSMNEAMSRGLEPNEWIQAEIERDSRDGVLFVIENPDGEDVETDS